MSEHPNATRAHALSEQGADHLVAGRIREAAECLTEAVHLDPRNPVIHYRLGIVHSDRGRPLAALAAYDTCLQLDKNFAKAHNNRGSVLQQLGRHDDAYRAFEAALALDPDLEPPYVNLGHLLEHTGRGTEACALYMRALERGLNEGLFRHHLAAASKEATDASPEAWVRFTFDNFAPQFDRHLQKLGYAVPAQLAALLLARAPGPFDLVDLGCGTGLCGQALAAQRGHFVGVDLSPRMLVEARKLGVYDELVAAEVQGWLAAAPEASRDVMLAADVFIYIGALEHVFHDVHRVLRAGGWFAFSIEECADRDYRLEATGRYAQAAAYIGRLAQHRFRIDRDVRAVLRVEEGTPVNGRLYLLQKA